MVGRKFDWDEAKRLRERGVLVREIAEQLGVSKTAIYHVTTPGALARARLNHAEWQRLNFRRYQYHDACVDCGGSCRTCSIRCENCHREHMSKPSVDSEGRCFCTKCEEWLSADRFGYSSTNRYRGFRRTECRACDNERRRKNRAAARERARLQEAMGGMV